MIRPLQIKDESKEQCTCSGQYDFAEEYCPKSDEWHREQARLRKEEGR